jgi:hypothetical protein
MVSCREQPAQGTCDWLKAKNDQNAFSGKARDTWENSKTSAIISSITNPR